MLPPERARAVAASLSALAIRQAARSHEWLAVPFLPEEREQVAREMRHLAEALVRLQSTSPQEPVP